MLRKTAHAWRRLVEQVLDLLVDRGGGLLRNSSSWCEIAATEDAVARIVRTRSGPSFSDMPYFMTMSRAMVVACWDIVGRAGGDIVKEELLGNAAAEPGDDASSIATDAKFSASSAFYVIIEKLTLS